MTNNSSILFLKAKSLFDVLAIRQEQGRYSEIFVQPFLKYFLPLNGSLSLMPYVLNNQ